MVTWLKRKPQVGDCKIGVPQFAEGCRRLRRTWQEVDGCIVPSGKEVAKEVAKMLAKGYDKFRIENTLNHEHLRMILSSFDHTQGEVWKDEDLLEVAEAYAAMIARTLEKQFPEKEFVVKPTQETAEDGWPDIIVTCYQKSCQDGGA